MRVCFHEDPVDVAALCADLSQHGAVYWHTTRPNFQRVQDLVREHGVETLSFCARPGGDFLNFMIRPDIVDGGLESIEKRVALAIQRWQDAGEPVPYSASI